MERSGDCRLHLLVSVFGLRLCLVPVFGVCVWCMCLVPVPVWPPTVYGACACVWCMCLCLVPVYGDCVWCLCLFGIPLCMVHVSDAPAYV